MALYYGVRVYVQYTHEIISPQAKASPEDPRKAGKRQHNAPCAREAQADGGPQGVDRGVLCTTAPRTA